MSVFRRWGGLIVLGVLFVGSWVGQFVAQLALAHGDAQDHGRPFEWGDFLTQFAASTLENWQSEWAQLMVQSILLGVAAHAVYGRYEAADADTVRGAVRDVLREEGVGRAEKRLGDPGAG